MTSTEMQGSPEVQRLCSLAGVSRAGYYRRRQERAPARADAELRDIIQKLSLKHRHYGYRRIRKQLHRDGISANAKLVLRLMREDNLLCLRARPYVPRTTNSQHGFRILPNLVKGLTPSGIDQIWVADLTYIRLVETFVYLAVVLDAFSRKVIGWALDDHLETRLALQALEQAIEQRRPTAGSLIHHSDRGVQYACNDYTGRLERSGIRISMSGVANPYDNAKAESFMKTLKVEEVNGKTYSTLAHARHDVGAFLEATYNTQRLHSALGYKPPVEFEADLNQSQSQ